MALANVHALLESAPDAVFVADLEGRVTYVNAAGCAMLGNRRDEIIGHTLFDFIPEEDVPRLQRAKAAMLGGRSSGAEWLLRRKDGSWVPVEVNANILPGGQWQGFAREISSRKAQQAERDALFAQVDRDRHWLRAVMDKMPLGVMLLEADGKITFNERAEQLLGMKLISTGGTAQFAGRVFFRMAGRFLTRNSCRRAPFGPARPSSPPNTPCAGPTARKFPFSAAPGRSSTATGVCWVLSACSRT